MNLFRILLRSANAREWMGILGLMVIAVSTVTSGLDGRLLLSSVTSYDAKPFDGTVMPIQKVPDWSNLASGEYYYEYSQLSSSKFVTIPEYRNDYLTYPSDDLGSSTTDKLIRNTKTTYPTAYAGNYEMDDSGEGGGSHPAVDIKALQDTPVYAIANGVVYDAGTSSSWGNFVVIEHQGVPDPDSSGTTTLYSSYSHLTQLFVSDGQVMEKGQVLGEVGDTGTATTAHLHFQIDKEDSPWRPYWPFTTAEASAAGYDFWDAVNHGVGQDNVYEYTTNPMEFVQEHLDEDATLSNEVSTSGSDSSTTSSNDVSSSTSEEDSTASSATSSDESSSSVVTVTFENMLIETPAFAQPGQNLEVKLQLLDGNGELTKEGTFGGEMSLTVSDETVAKLNRSSLTAADFSNGEATVTIYTDHAGDVSIQVSVVGRSYTSSVMYVVDNIEPFAKFGVAHDGYFVPGKPETIQIQALDLAGNPTPSFNGDGPVELSIVSGSGELEPSTLERRDLATGIAEVTFMSESTENVVIRVTYGTKESDSKTLESRLFNDLDVTNAYYPAVSYLYDKGTVEGYPDGTFQPDRTVSRVEALKFIFSGMDQSTESGLFVSFNDTYSSEWYYNYLASAYAEGVVVGYSDGSFKPSQGVNRVEFLKMLFNTVDISVDPVVTSNPYEDVDNLSWYAPYVQYAKEKNIFPISGSYFNPADPMSRLEVAEVIYRMITVNDNDGQSYSVLLRPDNL